MYEILAPITTAEVVVINEVDKASSAIRNSLLDIMNERVLFNGKEKIPCNWKLFVATCNEIPKDEMDSPFWDRFILKYQVNRISAGDMIRYYEKGGRAYRESMEVPIPNKAELETLELPISKLEKFLDVAYAKCSDRTLTFVPTLTRAVSFIWDCSIDKGLVKVVDLMINKSASSELQAKLMSNEVKTIMNKIDMLQSYNDTASIDAAMEEIEALLTGYAATGKIDPSQVQEIELAINYVLENHPVRTKEKEIEDVLKDVFDEVDESSSWKAQYPHIDQIKNSLKMPPSSIATGNVCGGTKQADGSIILKAEPNNDIISI